MLGTQYDLGFVCDCGEIEFYVVRKYNEKNIMFVFSVILSKNTETYRFMLLFQFYFI